MMPSSPGPTLTVSVLLVYREMKKHIRKKKNFRIFRVHSALLAGHWKKLLNPSILMKAALLLTEKNKIIDRWIIDGR